MLNWPYMQKVAKISITHSITRTLERFLIFHACSSYRESTVSESGVSMSKPQQTFGHRGKNQKENLTT